MKKLFTAAFRSICRQIDLKRATMLSLILVTWMTISGSVSFAQTEAFRVNSAGDTSLIYIGKDGSVAVDTSTTLGSLTVNGNNGIISLGAYGNGSALSLGAGTRMMWYPQRAAFRAGYVNGTQWNDANIGHFSAAMGNNAAANGDYSFAVGNSATASGEFSFAAGNGSSASGFAAVSVGDGTKSIGNYSTTMGSSTKASGTASTAMGNATTASGDYSTAMGDATTASSEYSVATGDGTIASGVASTAMGFHTTASGDYSTAMGTWVSTNSHIGSFILGDGSSGNTNTYSSADHQMMMRFSGGYMFYTNYLATIGAQLSAGANSWSTISDSTKKEHFLPVNGEDVLNKIDKFDLRTWNYKGQDPKEFRHYGPMAQEFFNAFGHDKYGVIGNDTTINQSDFEGVLLVAVQALEKRTREQRQESEALKEEVANQKEELETLQSAYTEVSRKLDKLANSMATSGDARVADLQK